MDKRRFLRAIAAVECCGAAHPLMTTVTMIEGAGLGDNQLVVVILCGGMDGLNVAQPLRNRDFAALRTGFASPAPFDLGAGFALRQGLADLHRKRRLDRVNISIEISGFTVGLHVHARAGRFWTSSF
jgi:uncharacterized protein (DUF1501 family)